MLIHLFSFSGFSDGERASGRRVDAFRRRRRRPQSRGLGPGPAPVAQRHRALGRLVQLPGECHEAAESGLGEPANRGVRQLTGGKVASSGLSLSKLEQVVFQVYTNIFSTSNGQFSCRKNRFQIQPNDATLTPASSSAPCANAYCRLVLGSICFDKSLKQPNFPTVVKE